MKHGRMQAKDIPDRPVLEFVERNPRATWFNAISPPNCVLHAMPDGIPPRLALAKMGMLMRRGLVNGCTCGCRGDFEITAAGRTLLGLAN